MGVALTSLASPASDGTDVVPWADTAAAPGPQPQYLRSPEGPPCSAGDVRPVVTEGSSQTGGLWVGRITVAHIGSHPCLISGPVRLFGLRPGGEPEEIELRSDPVWGNRRDADLRPGREAALVMRVSSRFTTDDAHADVMCPAQGPPAPYQAVRVILPSGETLDAAGGIRYLACRRRAQLLGSGFNVLDADKPIAEPLDRLTATVRAPDRAQPGTRLRFVVTLANPTSEPIRLDPCPSYRMRAGDGREVSYQLNCSTVRSIPAHDGRRFAMRIAVPTTGAGLQWQLQRPLAARVTVPLRVG